MPWLGFELVMARSVSLLIAGQISQTAVPLIHTIFFVNSVRFMLGGENGKLKYGPPDGHSPVCESLLPKEKLKIEPCFSLGNVPKGLICGLSEELDCRLFVPRPVDTSHVSQFLSIND